MTGTPGDCGPSLGYVNISLACYLRCIQEPIVVIRSCLSHTTQDLLSRNPNQRPDIEQVMRRPFIKEYISIVVADVHDSSDSLHNSQEAINAMNTQLTSLGMQDLVLDIEKYIDDVCAPELRQMNNSNASLTSSLSSLQSARSSSQSSTRKSSHSSNRSSRMSLLVHSTDLDYQNHLLELEEERCIASEMALERLRKKAEV